MPYSDIDRVAEYLMRIGRLGRFLPPSWDGCGKSIPVVSPEGGRLGTLLPGRGVYLNGDLETLGIKRSLPFVFERSITQRALDFFGRNEKYAVAAVATLMGAMALPRHLLSLVPTF